MSWAVEAQRAWQARTSEELARTWIAAIVERTPLDDLARLDLGWLAREAPAMITALLCQVDATRPSDGGAWAERCRGLAYMRGPSSAATEVPHDLATLHRLLAQAISRNAAEQGAEELLGRLERLTVLFGEVHSQFAQALVAADEGREGLDPVTGLPGEDELGQELAQLVAAGEGGSRPFAVLELDIDGLRHLNASAGEDAGDRLLRALADGAREALGGRVFRRSGDELVAVVPGADAATAANLASRLSAGTRADGVSIGVAAWPDHAREPRDLLERAREATYAAKASGEGVALPAATLLQRR